MNMKVHNDLKKLLENYTAYYDANVNSFYKHKDRIKLIDDFLFSNSLALGKTEPLAKNTP